MARAALVLGALLAVACASDLPPGLDPALEPVWHDFRELPEHRALAVAGDLRRKQWVVGASGGHPTHVEAEVHALRECERRRLERRIVAACRIYALGSEVVNVQSPRGTRGR